jgi:hypothetical protein
MVAESIMHDGYASDDATYAGYGSYANYGTDATYAADYATYAAPSAADYMWDKAWEKGRTPGSSTSKKGGW